MPGKQRQRAPSPPRSTGSVRSTRSFAQGSVGPGSALSRPAASLATLPEPTVSPYSQFTRVESSAYELHVDAAEAEATGNGLENGQAWPPSSSHQRQPFDPATMFGQAANDDDAADEEGDGSATPVNSSTASDCSGSTTGAADEQGYEVQGIYDDVFSEPPPPPSPPPEGHPQPQTNGSLSPPPPTSSSSSSSSSFGRQEAGQPRGSKRAAPPPPLIPPADYGSVHEDVVDAGSAQLASADATAPAYEETDPTDSTIYEDLEDVPRRGSSKRPPQRAKDAESDMRDAQQITMDFNEHLEVMSPLEEAEEERLRKQSIEQKYMILFQQKEREQVYQMRHYVDNLRLHGDASRKRMSMRKMAKQGITPLASLLRKLKLDLKLSGKSFCEKFISPPHHGIQLLLQVLREIQADQKAILSAKKAKQATDAKQNLTDEYDCLICLKLAIKAADEGVAKLLSYPGSLESIVVEIISSFVKIRVVTLEMLYLCCHDPDGYHQVDDAFTQLRLVMSEAVRFKLLHSMLSSTANVQFQVATVKLFNRMWQCIVGTAKKVFFQQELLLAGFEADDYDRYGLRGTGPEYDMFQKELDTWRSNVIRIHHTQEKMVDMETRNDYLRAEIDRLQGLLKDSEGSLRRSEAREQGLQEKNSGYREKAAELQDTVAKLKSMYERKTGEDLQDEDEANVDRALMALDKYATVRGDRFGTSRSASSDQAVPAPPSVRVLPPAPPPAFLSKTVRKKVGASADLPLLNWTPLVHTARTMFEEMDDEAKLREVDFAEFERRFRLPVKQESDVTRAKRARIFSAQTDAAAAITFVEPKRANIMLITKNKTKLSGRQISTAIEQCKVKPIGDPEEDLLHPPLSGEYAELLLKFVPTKEEIRLLSQHAADYDKMGEAEQFLFQMVHVERPEKKLTVMAFMGCFDELIETLLPQIENVSRASHSVVANDSLKGVFELILAFGNYMNSSKRGYALGFKLESLGKLEEVKSTDKSQSLLEYLVQLIERQYPHLADFYDDLDVHVDKGVSFQSMSLDVMDLRKGLDIVKFERTKQPDNQAIDDFHRHAAGLVARAAESFHQMEQQYKRMCAMFGEDYRTAEPFHLFRMLQEFIHAFKRAQEKETYDGQSPMTPKTPTSPKPLSMSPTKQSTTTSHPMDPPSWVVTSPSSPSGPQLPPSTAATMRNIAKEVASAATDSKFLKNKQQQQQQQGKSKRNAPPPPPLSQPSPAPPADLPDSLNLNATATIDKKVGEKILIFEKKIKNTESPKREVLQSPWRVPQVGSAWKDEDDYDDVVAGQRDSDEYDDAMTGRQDDYYDDAMVGQQGDIYDDTAAAAATENIYDDTDVTESAVYEGIPHDEYENTPTRSNPRTAAHTSRSSISQGSAEATAAPAPRLLPRTPVDQLPEPVQMRKISKKAGKRITIPSGEYHQIEDGGGGGGEEAGGWRSRTATGGDSAAVNEALGAFDAIFTSTSVRDFDTDYTHM